MANTTILLNGFSIIGDPHTNTNASHGGQLMIHSGTAVFGGDDIVTFEVEGANPDGSLNPGSKILGIKVYENATAYHKGEVKFTYATAPKKSVTVGDGRAAMGDTYLQVDAKALVSASKDAPALGKLTMVAGVDILGELAHSKGPLTIDTFQKIDLDHDGKTDVGGDGKFSSDVNLMMVVCFTRGTLIETPQGYRRAEALVPGDLVNTLDNGPQAIRWIGIRSIEGTGRHAPILIRRGALGNVRDLLVSPNHRLLVRGPRAELLFGMPEVLVAAKYLVNGTTIRARPMAQVDYIHFLTDQHDIVFAEACPAETLYPGRPALGTLSAEAQAEIVELFPGLRLDDCALPLCRPELATHEAALLQSA